MAQPAAATPFRILNATARHMPGVQAIYAHYVEHGTQSFEETAPDVAEMTARFRRIQARSLPYVVAVDDAEEVLGYAYAGPFRERAAYRYTVEDSVYVKNGLVGQGIGRALLGELIRRAETAGFRQMVAVIGGSRNTASIAMHAHHRFREVGRFHSVGYKFGTWLDCIFMQRTLGNGDSDNPA